MTTKPALPEPVATIVALAAEHAKADKARFECARYIACYEDGPQEQADLRRLTAASATAYEAFVSGIRTAIEAAVADYAQALSSALGWPGGISDPVLDWPTLLRYVAEARAEMQERTADQLRTIKALMVGMPDEGTTPVIRRIAWLEQQLSEARAVPEGWQSVIQSVLHNNGGPIDAGSTVDGKDYVMVLRSDFDALAALAATPSPAEQPKPAVLDELLAWAVSRWESEVRHRPLVNKNRRSLDDTWRQVIRFAGGDPDALLGPAHDALLAALQGEPHDQA